MVYRAATVTAPAPDPAITLFGRRISVLEPQPEIHVVVRGKPVSLHDLPADGDTNIHQDIVNPALVPGPDNHDELTKGVIAGTPVEDDKNHDDKNQDCSIDDNSTICADNDQSSQQKVLKKPDKILPCPRCNSLDTKFCYYNNYNVNQPRYYCKNCERYWTDGGTMRNVPVGAGRRKNKHTANHYRIQGTSSEGMASPGNNVSLPPPGKMQPSCTPQHESGNMVVFKFRPKEPHCQTEADPLNLGENSEVKQTSSTPNECEKNSSASVTVTGYARNKPSDDVSKVEKAGPAYAEVASVHPVQGYPGNHWAFLGSPGWNNAPFAAVGSASDMACGENGRTNVIPWNPTSFMSASAFVSPAIPFSFIPASFWGCMASWPAGAWNAPLVGYNGSVSLSSSSSSLASPTSNEHSGDQLLKTGKRCRDESLQVGDKAAASLWFPKTLRIDDPDQAAKSSIWATLGFKHDQSKSVTKGTMFKCFQSETERKIPQPDASEVLDANPAALSRSQAFQESS